MQLERLGVWEKLNTVSAKDLIFLDESGVNLSLVRLFARSRLGQRAYGERPQKRGLNVSIIGAISLQGLITQCCLIGGKVNQFNLFSSRVINNIGWINVFMDDIGYMNRD